MEAKQLRSNLKIYSLEFHVLALKEWNKLDGSIQVQFQKALKKRLQEPKIPSAKLRGDLQNAYKIKLRDVGYRLVYQVIDQRLVIVIVAIGRRDNEEAYLAAAKRIN
ncbi:MAG: type II toxin-antitoxin system RelE/ParE family toxin [Betaproteobacteria bacterium]|nr:type II toxin-antitoxin system RelE/ParE family toxin [Betaproteobacteria bacterium]NBT69578.1 type II toxin-antitoxin system RelE/ParE family toxin [Betaproteobacteria bacterium]